MNCQIEFANDDVGMPCGKPAVVKCGDCGAAICSDCCVDSTRHRITVHRRVRASGNQYRAEKLVEHCVHRHPFDFGAPREYSSLTSSQ